MGQQMMARLRFLRQAQWWGLDQLEEERADKLGKLLAVAYREVPFYRSLFGDRCGSERLENLPDCHQNSAPGWLSSLTTRDTGSAIMKAARLDLRVPIFVSERIRKLRARHRAFISSCPGMVRLSARGAPFPDGYHPQRGFIKGLKDRLLRCTYFSAFDLSDDALDRGLHHLDHRGICHIQGYPGSLYYFARRAIETGWNRPLRGIVTWGDTLYAHYRETIERAFGTSSVGHLWHRRRHAGLSTVRRAGSLSYSCAGRDR